MTELETEKEELTEYEQLDKHRRALEYNLYDKELSKATEQLGQIEVVREEERDRQQRLHARLRAIQDELQVEEELGLTVRQALDRLVARRGEKASELAEIVSRRSAIEVELQETEVRSCCHFFGQQLPSCNLRVASELTLSFSLINFIHSLL